MLIITIKLSKSATIYSEIPEFCKFLNMFYFLFYQPAPDSFHMNQNV